MDAFTSKIEKGVQICTVVTTFVSDEECGVCLSYFILTEELGTAISLVEKRTLDTQEEP